MKRRYLLLVAMVICVASIMAGGYFFASELYAFKVNVKKYTEINIPKNQGMFNVLLKVMDTSVSLIPDRTFVLVDESRISELRRFVVNASVSPENVIEVKSIDTLRSVLSTVSSPTKIVMHPGEYSIEQSLNLPMISGAGGPYILTAQAGSDVVFKSATQEAMIVKGANWVIEGVEFQGVCDFDSYCEHAIHIVGDADNITIQNNTFKNFNAHVKSNGLQLADEDRSEFPDNVKILNNRFYNQWMRDTKNPVTPLDVVGGDNWLVAGNFVADFAKKRGNKTAYGMFLKGGGENGRFESNLVACEWKLRSSVYSDVRIGLSLGGGGTGNKYCADDKCDIEHRSGVITNNTIINCPNDVAVYLNKAANTTLADNRLLNTVGLSARGSVSSASATNNHIQGIIAAADSATITEKNNTFVHFFERF
ncbi:hypothetical protein [Alteromonas gilva]|uniref:Right handed beta helix domain-containing protein n=1 Tax=Alteromonas gilva TaxID=2987522 RepID=A0ABT5L1P6_9ALTE|nr:hypothetical protein [Alteromonas gilva]MDC8830334.1 hypothetical protein [Alteromonas gilva]